MSYRLFLDDVRDPYKVTWVQMPLGPWVIARDYAEFCGIIETKGVPEFVAFDHDLADEHYRPSMYNPDRHYSNYYTDGTFREKTGYDCAKWLIEYCFEKKLPLPARVCHSMNPIGRENIQKLFESAEHHGQA
jgi:hypothetical protein